MFKWQEELGYSGMRTSVSPWAAFLSKLSPRVSEHFVHIPLFQQAQTVPGYLTENNKEVFGHFSIVIYTPKHEPHDIYFLWVWGTPKTFKKIWDPGPRLTEGMWYTQASGLRHSFFSLPKELLERCEWSGLLELKREDSFPTIMDCSLWHALMGYYTTQMF